jgi:hypothetical protein
LMPLKVNSTPFFLILQLQAFQNGGRLNFWGGVKKPLNNRWTDWWIWIKFCMEVMTFKVTSMPYSLIWMKFCIVVMTLKVTSIIPKWLSVIFCTNNFEPVSRFSWNLVRR